MALRRWSIVVLAASIFASLGAEHRTQNFVVRASSNEVAEKVGQWAEYYRRAKAIEWLGHEMPAWSKPCPLTVTVSGEGPSGETSFNFHPQGGVLDMDMKIRGPLDRLLASVLPHEITHTVFAYHFRRAVPRWADEGGSVLSEDDVERDRHDKIVRQILNQTQQFRLRQLFNLNDYPGSGDKVMCLYAEGFSVSDYLVYISDRQTFLRFVGMGMRGNWDQAAQACYGKQTVEQLEDSWLKHLRDTRGMTVTQRNKKKETDKGQAVASVASGAGGSAGQGGTLVRLTAPPGDAALQPVPIYRGAMPGPGQSGQNFGGQTAQPKPGYLPDILPSASSPQRAWQANPQQGGLAQQQGTPIGVQLGVPQYPPPSQMIPQAVSPVGYPR